MEASRPPQCRPQRPYPLRSHHAASSHRHPRPNFALNRLRSPEGPPSHPPRPRPPLAAPLRHLLPHRGPGCPATRGNRRPPSLRSARKALNCAIIHIQSYRCRPPTSWPAAWTWRWHPPPACIFESARRSGSAGRAMRRRRGRLAPTWSRPRPSRLRWTACSGWPAHVGHGAVNRARKAVTWCRTTSCAWHGPTARRRIDSLRLRWERGANRAPGPRTARLAPGPKGSAALAAWKGASRRARRYAWTRPLRST